MNWHCAICSNAMSDSGGREQQTDGGGSVLQNAFIQPIAGMIKYLKTMIFIYYFQSNERLRSVR